MPWALCSGTFLLRADHTNISQECYRITDCTLLRNVSPSVNPCLISYWSRICLMRIQDWAHRKPNQALFFFSPFCCSWPKCDKLVLFFFAFRFITAALIPALCPITYALLWYKSGKKIRHTISNIHTHTPQIIIQFRQLLLFLMKNFHRNKCNYKFQKVMPWSISP